MDRLKAIIKGSLKSKTMWFSGIIMALGAVSDNAEYLRNLLDPQSFNMVMIVIGVVVAILRIQTTKPLEEK
jgi:hypothetical protein